MGGGGGGCVEGARTSVGKGKAGKELDKLWNLHPVRDEYGESTSRESLRGGGGGEQEPGKEYKKKWWY